MTNLAHNLKAYDDWFYSQSPTPTEWLMLIGLVFFSAMGICLLIDEVKKAKRLKKHFDKLEYRWDRNEND